MTTICVCIMSLTFGKVIIYMQGIIFIHNPKAILVHSMAFVAPAVEHWLE